MLFIDEAKEAKIGCNIDEEEEKEENNQEDKTDDSSDAGLEGMELVENTSNGGRMATVVEASQTILVTGRCHLPHRGKDKPHNRGSKPEHLTGH
mgnify:CR=1 FL=1